MLAKCLKVCKFHRTESILSHNQKRQTRTSPVHLKRLWLMQQSLRDHCGKIYPKRPTALQTEGRAKGLQTHLRLQRVGGKEQLQEVPEHRDPSTEGQRIKAHACVPYNIRQQRVNSSLWVLSRGSLLCSSHKNINHTSSDNIPCSRPLALCDQDLVNLNKLRVNFLFKKLMKTV